MASKNPISCLQELSVVRWNKHPVYEFEEVKTQEFKCRVTLSNRFAVATAIGKKAAKIKAAELLLKELQSDQQLFIPKVLHTKTVTPPRCAPRRNICLSEGTLNTYKSIDVFHPLSNHTKIQKLPDLSSVREVSSYSNSCKSSDIVPVSSAEDVVDRSTRPTLPSHSYSVQGISKNTAKDSNPVALLKEIMDKKNKTVKYEEINVIDDGTDEPSYYYEVEVAGETAIGSGPSKKIAKANAAASMMDILKIGYKSFVEPELLDIENYIGKLHTFCMNNNIKHVPSYELIDPVEDSKCFRMKCTLDFISVEQEARNKKTVKHMCAKKLLLILESNQEAFKLKDLQIQSRINDPDINEQVWERLQQTGVRNNIIFSSNFKNIAIKNYLYLIESGFYGQSEMLAEVKSKRISEFCNAEDTVLCIFKELDITYELSRIPSEECVVYNIFLKCNPNWSFTEVGLTAEEAKKNLFLSVLEFFQIM